MASLTLNSKTSRVPAVCYWLWKYLGRSVRRAQKLTLCSVLIPEPEPHDFVKACNTFFSEANTLFK